MKEFALLFRMDITTESAQPTQEQMDIYMQDWMKWIQAITQKGQLAEGGNHFSRGGRLIRAKRNISEGPYTFNNESVAGYVLIFAKDLDDATLIAEKCPILNGEGTSVEIRETATPGSMD